MKILVTGAAGYIGQVSSEEDLDAVCILHGITSAGSEADTDLGYRVNLYSVLKLLEALARRCPGVRVIYTSSIAAYGAPLADLLSEDTVCTPQTSYGTHKVMVEAVLNDYNRRGCHHSVCTSACWHIRPERKADPSSKQLDEWT
ncbi:NAD(P)-binding domain protein [Metarhizium album ARSEF 1941]|uniref:NAD(P)-binding domain protein n=1 Tax=Metarhizium album (strain ARSEF 1941) TaxID=1081103 RepID=A0A0B2WHQ3_METAS|nr:NAD(P)-binding domain protein [Metarhizium album ARSEF 1941]KHN95551.1 NAD(P)-binding domain protein [Metarhizium album ARSEF 1941]